MIIIIILMLLFLLNTSTSFPVTVNYTAWACNNSTGLLGASFDTNVNNLLSILVSNISTAKTGFFIHKQPRNTANLSYYGLAMCRGDLDSIDCHNCIEMATKLVKQNCNKDPAIFWMEDCMIRYSNQSFFGEVQVNPNRRMNNKDYIQGDVQNRTKLLQNTLGDIVHKAASGDNKYATKEAYFRPMNAYLYTLAQCTPDLCLNNCSKCLKIANSHQFVTVLSRGGIVLLPSCTLRYELYEFYYILNLNQSTLSPPNSTNIAQISTGKKNQSSTRVLVAIIAPLAAVGLLIALCACPYRRKAKDYRSLEVKNVLSDLTTAESLTFELETLEAATHNFSDEQKLGQGGFGSVYKVK